MLIDKRRETFRFRDFELDLGAYELRHRGRRVKLGRQPMDLLIILVEHRGQLVSRADLIEQLWGNEVFVDVETGVNTAISKIRQALRDAVESPKFVETVPGKGYRFIADVEVAAEPVAADVSPSQLNADRPAVAAVAPAPRAEPQHDRFRARAAVGITAIVVAVALLVWTAYSRRQPAPRTSVSIAVLPIVNLGHDPERDYLAIGLTNETSASLAQVAPDQLIVKGRTLHYKGTTKTAVEIGQELAVDYLLEGTIRAEGQQLRITATLIRVRDQGHVWTQSYDREPTSVLGLQQDLATDIAQQVRVRLITTEKGRSPDRQTQSAAAFDAYLKGRYFQSRRTAATMVQAVEQYKRAIELDPNYALAWASLAFSYASSTLNSDTEPLAMAPLAREAATRAIRANPNLAEAQFAVGYVKWILEWDWPGAEAAFRTALKLDPSDATVHRVLGHALSQSGKHDDAERAMRRNRELEPLEPLAYALSSQVAFQGRHYRAAIEHARRAIQIDPAFWIGYAMLGQAFEQTGETSVALEALKDAARFSGRNSKNTALTGYLLAKAGRTEEGRAVLGQLESTARERYVPPYAFALVQAGLAQRDSVFDWLEKAYASRDVHLIFLPVDAKWDPYRTDPRFVELLARCGFTPRPPKP